MYNSRYQGKGIGTRIIKEIRRLLNELQFEYNYNDLDSMLVLKDILAHEYLDRNKKLNNYNNSL